MIPIAHPLIGEDEQKAVAHALASGQLAQGANVAEFEKKFAAVCHTKDAVAVNSGTAALHLALLAYGVKAGDEVITTPFTFAATANVVEIIGAIPVFVDIDPLTYNMNPALIEQAITPKTKAIMPVHLFGYPSDMPAIMKIAEAHHLVVVEDACQAHAASINGQPVGSFTAGGFSFYPTKNITTGEGGAVTADDLEFTDKIRIIRNQGQKERYKQIALGYNLRMTDIHAAIGLAQLPKLEQFTQKRITNAAYLTERLANYVQTPVVADGYRHVFHQYTIRARKNRDQWISALAELGVGTGIYYPRTIYHQPYYQEIGVTGNCPESEAAAEQVLALPVHPALTDAELEKVADSVIAVAKRLG